MSAPLAPTRQPCTCVDETWCPSCTASRANRRPWNPGATQETAQQKATQQAYYERNRTKILARGTRYRATHRPPRRDAEVSPLPAALVAAALSGMPKLWWHADVFGDGAYLWHCNRWSKIDQLPHVCPTCGARFFEKETA